MILLPLNLIEMDSTPKVISPDEFHFHTVDYCVFAAMLIFSATSGGYFGFVKYVKTDSFICLQNSKWLHQIDKFDFIRCVNCRKKADNGTETQETSANGATKKPVQFGSSSMNEYLLGSRKLKPFPVAMSLVARYLSLTPVCCDKS